jgi:shikimate dehydrogenase
LDCRRVSVFARRPAVAAADLASVTEAFSMNVEVLPWPGRGERLPDRDRAPITVSAVPVGEGVLAAVPPRPGILLDVAYTPWPPALVTAWRASGGVAVAGDLMLLHQAALQVQIMSGSWPDLTPMRQALRMALK